MQKFGIGQPATRFEDGRLLSGKGRYVEDIELENQSFATFVRSPHAHAEIKSVDTEEAKSMPGVLGIYTVADLKDEGIGNIPCMAPANNKDGSPCVMPPRPALADAKVRHVGDAVAIVIAETREESIDAAEQVWVDYEILPAVVETNQATLENSSEVWRNAKNNTCFDWEAGNKGDTNKAFTKAKQVVELDLINNRVVPT